MEFLKKYLAISFCFAASASFSQRGIDGNKTINAAGTIVNEYTTLTADATAGVTTTISVSASGLNANGRFGAGNNLAAGDLIMIIQMEGPSSSTTSSVEFPAASGQFYGFPNDRTWGQITAYNNCGNYELCEVSAVPSATSITVDCSLKNSYTAAGRVQVIRVPRYNTLTITGTGVLTCQAWVAVAGVYTGGVVAVEVYGATTINAGGSISAASLGFRGGSKIGDNVTTLGGGQVGRSDPTEGAEKGEGIFGYQADYNVFAGRYCRGVAGNAGGGGDAHNAGGGGGSNAGNPGLAWDGEGNPDLSGGAPWTLAWNLEVTPTFSTHTSSGGGRGGYSFSSQNRDATLEGPKPFQGAGTNFWNGDYRENNGGWGGRPLDYSTGKIFLGGGGGAGDQDNGCAGNGGAGGGIVYVMSYGTIGGAGTINANGAAGSNTTTSGIYQGIDGAGGGGGGGTIILNTVGAVSGITASANGGVGGNQNVLPAVNEAEGPGGGGGGGYVAIATGAIGTTVTGGANGITNSASLTEFTPNGATKGAAGLTNQIITYDTISAANVTICSGNTATLTATMYGTVPVGTTISWYAAQAGGAPLGSGTTFTTPVLVSTTTYYVGFCPGTYRIPVVVTVNTGPTVAAAGPNQTVCSTSATFAGNTPVTGSGLWTLVSGAGTITTPASPTSTVTGLGAGANVFQWTITSAGCPPSTSSITITNTGGPTTAAAGANQTVCGTTAALAGNTPVVGTGLWTLVSGAGTITTPTSPTSGVTALGVGANVFQWTISNAPCPPSTSAVTITGVAAPTVAAAGPNQTVCGTTATLAGNNAAIGSGLWTLVSGAGTITTPASPTSGITALGVGANVFQWTISNAPCPSSSSTVTITGIAAPTVAAAGPNQTVCGTTATLAGNNAVVGSGVWTLVSGAGTITTPASPTSGLTALGVGANVFQWTISNAPCPSSSSTVTITGVAAPTVAAAGPNQTVCAATATLAGNNAIVGSGLWTLVSGAGTITTPSSPTSGVTALGVGANVFQWTISNAPCPSSSSTVTITRNAPPTVAAAGPNQTVCGTTATLAGNNAAIGSGLWTLVSGAGTITTPASPTSGLTALGVGANVFQWTISNAPCPSSTSTFTITGVAAPTVATAGPNQTVCGTTATLAGNNAVIGSGLWTLVSGAGTITTPASSTSGLTALGVGANVFQWTISNAPCPSSTSTVTITGVAAPTISAAGPNQSICSTSATFAGNAPVTGSGLWTLVSGAGTITTPASPTSTVTGLGAGANIFQWTISNAPCPSSSSTVTITNTGGPTTSVAGANQTVCGTTATLAGNVPVVGTGLWTLVSGAGTITTPTSPTSGITALGVGANVFQWTISNAPCPPSTSTVTITGVAAPTVAAAGPNQTVCGTTATLAGNNAVVGSGLWTLVSGAGTITTPASPTSGITALGVGANVFQWTISNAPCPSSSSTVTITGTTSPTVATAGPDQTICGTSATLAGNNAAIGSGIWTLVSGAGTIITPASSTSGVTALGVGANVFQWTISNAPCPSSSSTVTINASPFLDPTITSPGVLCISAPPINLTAASSGGTWSGPGITSSSAGTFDPSTAGIGPHPIIYTDPIGSCGGADTITVTVSATADATITQPPPICIGATPFNLAAASAGGTWTGTGITNSVAGTFDPSSGIGSDTITYTISGSCGAVDTVIVTVTSLADATITQQAPLCIGSSPVNLTDATGGGIWTGTGITDSAAGTFNPGTAGIGTHVITYTISGSCGNVDTMTITVTTPANAAITTVTPVCANATPFNLSAATPGGTWSGTAITDPVNGTFDPSAATAGANVITYSIGGACGDTATLSLTVNPLPTPSFSSDITGGCAPACVTFTEAAGNNCNTMSWVFGDGNTSSSSTSTNCYTAAGTYSVTISCTDLNNCTGTTTITNMITVAANPVAAFTVSPSGVVPANTSITFTDASTSGGIQGWDFGDPSSGLNNISNSSSPSHTFGAEGTYCVTLISGNISGCVDSTQECVVVANDATFSIPNVFTPNGDGTNDVFFITSTSLKELTCSVYDRWGLKIAEWNTINGGWDGRTTSGGIASDGVYYYIMKATALNEKITEKQGFIQLLKDK